MATVARMLVEMAGDPSGLRRAFRQSVQDAQAFGRDLRQAVNTSQNIVDGAGYAAAGRRISDNIIKGFTAKYEADMATAREQMARGIVSPAQFRQAGELAAANFNNGVLAGIDNLRGRSLLPPDVHAKLVAELKEAGMQAGREARLQLAAQLRQVGDDLRGLGNTLSSAGRTMTVGVTLPLVAFGTAASKMAADANESFNKFDVLFGRLAGGVRTELAAMHSSIPATNAALQDMASNFQALLVPMGFSAEQAAKMSTRLTLLGGDLTSLHNIPVGETMTRLFSGLIGEAEAVRRFGVDISDARLKVLAHNAGLGDNVQALTRAQKTTLIFGEILRSTSVAHGDAAATAGSAANQMRFLARDAQEAAQVFGQRLLPTLVPLMQSLSRVLESVGKLSPATLDMAIKFALVAAAVGPVLSVVGTLIGLFGTLTLAAAATATASAGAAVGIAGAGAAAAGTGSAMGGLGLALMGPAGVIIGLGLAAVGLLAWIDHSQRAKRDVDALAASFRSLTAAQLQSRMTEESRKMQELQQRRDRIVSRPVTGGSAGQQDVQDMGNAAALSRVNSEIQDQQALLNGLGTAWQQVAAAKAASDAADAVNIRRYDAMLKALQSGMAGTAAAAKAAAAAERVAKKEHTEYMQVLAGSTSSLTDMYAIAQRLHLSTGGVATVAIDLFRQIQGEIDKAGGQLDANTAKLYNMLDALLKIKEVAASPFSGMLPQVQQSFTRPQGGQAFTDPRGTFNPAVMQPITLANIARPAQLGGGAMTAPGANAGAPGSMAAVYWAEAMVPMRAFGVKLREMVAPIGSAIAQTLNPLKFFGGVFQQFAQALQPVLQPLVPVFQQIAAIVAEALAPVLQALVPVFQSLIPVVRAVMQVLAPILTALVPLFKAMVPILNALFPIFKAVAIAATFVGQAFGIAASIVMRAVGNIIIGFGQIMYALAKGIDSLPFVSAGHAMDVANGIIETGRAMLQSSDEFKKMADDMAHAREDIKKVNLDPAAEGAQKLADATNAAADALTNVPNIFRFRQRLTEQWDARELGLGGGGTGTVPVRPSDPNDTNPSTSGTDETTPERADRGAFVIHGDVIVYSSGDGEETLDNMEAAARRRALATSGQGQRGRISG